MTVIAVIDLGSNSVRMTVSRYHHDGSYEVLARFQEMVRLSTGMGPDKVLQPEAVARTLTALNKFKQALKVYDNDKVEIHAVATAAVRQASNQAEFLIAFKKEMGFELNVLTGEEEAHFDFVGVINTFPINDALILDTGGASSELILVRNKQAVHAVSLPVGAVNISESYLEKDHISAGALFSAIVALRQLFGDISWLRESINMPLIALGGSNRTLAKISRKKEKIQGMAVHGYHLNVGEVALIYQNILKKDLEERKKMPGLAKERGDIIVGGLLPLVELLLFTEGQQVIFSQSGLREGILFEQIATNTGHNVVSPEPAAMTIDTEDL
ncbi:MAG: Ppx/GppA family phosphatase [Leuconostoc gelidum]|jgi:exopolyphosphatase/guanosine-5'-triphosphate,3'-diphosphate pyrophosphatase|uniref:Ppx/GppA family phosphatase n=1 Tax=Leuconostoc gelidum subsp. gelidum TaxID=1607839 RepID=A0AB35G0X7_LEUGE|nr:Ppx/GppA family phosphatase [Leuconostoc gelidum]AFS41030.1 exopolyphosphatase [Leuconostoc gelidum JB7]MBZ5963432.1 Ppx/GppA family phosphatase [Leuconostoc gelidum subsp. gelidum]MBZ5974582.1 Ppx/GppA family phosphatase [Leuconostoc gelidum subsp. gelidum]MBZ5976816.1 Ppx/GppA family phosphatase [Leuconostoc gelidum subsp. gelidum]MBZ5979283.1 Ppx/GppA family phosphatase [Leuconostoc gelidum subsp. gelidum]